MSQRILFYSHDTIGLGHLERTLAIAGELARRRPRLSMLIATGAPVLPNRPLPPQVDLLRLPTSTHRDLYTGLPEGGVSPPAGLLGLAADTGVWQVRAEVIRAAALAFQPHLFVADHEPAGIHNEVIPALTLLRERGQTRTAIVLDEFVADGEYADAIWSGITGDLLRHAYDRILVRGDRAVFDSAVAYGLPADLVDRLAYTGYVAARPQADAVAAWRRQAKNRPLVVVTVGGGGDGAQVLLAYLAALREGPPLAVTSLLVLGPLMRENDRRRMQDAAKGIPGVLVRTEIARLVDALAAADLIVTMAGYSSIAEALALGARTIAIPRMKPWPEQRLRAERLAAIGVVTMVHPDAATPDRLRAAIDTTLAAPPPGHAIDCNGLSTQADLLLDLLPADP